MPDTGEDTERQGLSFVTGRMSNGTAALKDSWAISFKIKHTLAMKSSKHVPWYLPKETGN